MEKKINLIPLEIQREWRLRRYKKVMAAVGVIYLAVLALIFLGQSSETRKLKAEVETRAAEVAALAAGSAEYRTLTVRLAEFTKANAELKGRLASVTELAGGRIAWSTILKRLSNDLPETVWLRALTTSDGEAPGTKKVRFLGSALTSTAVADFIFTLENSGYMKGVNLSYSQRRDFLSKTVYDFEVYATLTRTGEVASEW